MTTTPHTQSEFRRLVHACIDKAEKLYDLDFGRVTITFDLKGEKAAWALQYPHPTMGYFYKLRFNRDAIRIDWDQMVNGTIPHEVAHLVAFAKPSLRAENHDFRWRKIAIALGDKTLGKAQHTMDLPPARRLRRFLYRDERGHSVAITPKFHNRVQAGEVDIRYGEHVFTAHHFRDCIYA